MSAGLASKANGQAALWLNGEPAWHHLGKVWDVERDGKVTLDIVLDEAGLDFSVEKRPMFFGATDESKMGTAPVTEGQMFATVRTDTEQQLGTVGRVYEPFQNRQAFEFLSDVTGQSDAYFESAGMLAHGAKVFVSMKLGEDILIDGKGAGDRIAKYLFVTTGHDGKSKVDAVVGPVRPVCTNTVRMGLAKADYRWAVRHTKGGLDRLKEAARTVVKARDYYDELEVTANTLHGVRMTNAQFDRFLSEVAFPVAKDARDQEITKARAKADQARELFRTAKTQENIRGTRWAALNALTEQIDHFADVRVPKSLRLGADVPDSLATDIAKGARLINGSDDDRKTVLTKQLLTWRR